MENFLTGVLVGILGTTALAILIFRTEAKRQEPEAKWLPKKEMEQVKREMDREAEYRKPGLHNYPPYEDGS